MNVSLYMGWRHLLFANWPVAPETVASRLPDGLAVDTYDGQAWLSVVPYVNVDVRPRRVPAGFGLGFRLPELNLRTYVTCKGESGVYFFSLDAEGVVGVVGARLLHGLPYYYADIDATVADDGRIRFESRRRHPGARAAEFVATYGPSSERFRSKRGSLAEFLTERYRVYTEGLSGEIRYADIYHDRWSLYSGTVETERNTLFEADGFDHPEGDPICYYSPGVDVLTSPSRRVRTGE